MILHMKFVYPLYVDEIQRGFELNVGIEVKLFYSAPQTLQKKIIPLLTLQVADGLPNHGTDDLHYLNYAEQFH